MTPKVAHMMGVGDYCVITAGGARVCYGGTDPNATGGTTPPIVAVPPVNNLPYPDGTPLQATGQAAVYLVDNGQIRWIPDGQTLESIFGANGFSEVIKVPASVLALYPQGPPLSSVAGAGQGSNQYLAVPSAPIAESVTTAATQPAATVAAPASTYVSSTAGTISTVLQSGATYNAAGGYYLNPDGSIYYPAATSTSTFDISSPSTWPTWVWLALSAGAAWMLFFRGRR